MSTNKMFPSQTDNEKLEPFAKDIATKIATISSSTPTTASQRKEWQCDSKILKTAPIFLGIGFKIFTSITLVPLNKYIYITYKFPNMTLTFIHFVITFLGVLLLNLLGVFEAKRVPVRRMLPMAFSFCGFVALNNMSLELNTIGVSTFLKILTMPTVTIISRFGFGVRYTRRIVASTLLVVFGILINSIFDISLNANGIVVGLLAVIVTSLYQIWIDEKQKEFEINSLQLLFYQAPLSAVILLFFMPLFEGASINRMMSASIPAAEITMVLLSGFLAFLFNWSVFWIIGSTSPLTYNMIGNFKFVVTIMIGIIFFDDPFHLPQIFSILVVFCGLTAYSYFKYTESEKNKQLSNMAAI